MFCSPYSQTDVYNSNERNTNGRDFFSSPSSSPVIAFFFFDTLKMCVSGDKSFLSLFVLQLHFREVLLSDRWGRIFWAVSPSSLSPFINSLSPPVGFPPPPMAADINCNQTAKRWGCSCHRAGL